MRQPLPDRVTDRGFTLVELLISVALGMLMMSIAWTVFSRSKAAAHATRERILLHQTASLVRQSMQRDFAVLSPTVAVFCRSLPDIALGNPENDRTDTVEFLTMSTLAPLGGRYSPEGWLQVYKQDYHWVRWQFVRTRRPQPDGTTRTISHVLNRSQSTPVRAWKTNSNLKPNSPAPRLNQSSIVTYDGQTFANMSRPLRDAAEGVASLDNNRYNQPASTFKSDERINVDGDIGDLADLNEADLTFSDQVRDFRIGWVDASGGEVSVGCDAAADHRINGLYLDITGPGGNAYMDQLKARPRIIRVSFSLANRNGSMNQNFALSFAAPGMMPTVAP